MTMDESAEGQTILEAEMEILDIDLGLVGGGLSLAPEQETLFGRQLCVKKAKILCKSNGKIRPRGMRQWKRNKIKIWPDSGQTN